MIMKTHSIAQMCLWPGLLYLYWWIRLDGQVLHMASPRFLQYITFFFKFMYYGFRIYIGFSSLVIAICRWCFIIHDNWVSKFGIERFRRLMISISLLVPLTIAFLSECTITIQPSFSRMIAKEPLENMDTNDTAWSNNIQSPIFNFVESHVASSAIYGVTIFCYGVMAVIFTNIFEGILYVHTWMYFLR